MCIRDSPTTAHYRRRDPLHLNQVSLGVGYMDECTTFSVNYIMTPRDDSLASGERDRNQTLLFRLELRTLGAATVQQQLSGGADDGTADR